ncbi:MAG: phosphatase PAP2 family protein [Candidatus Aminicenantes bacterium]|nr:phosphatase PAP2 family protein [Candidatus Aminicenantes bacterium]
MLGIRKKRTLSFFLALVLILLFHQSLLLGENSASEPKLDKEFFLKFGKDFKETLFSPKDWKKKDFLTFSAVLGAGTLIYVLDQEIQDWAQSRRTIVSEDFASIGNNIGHGFFLTGLIAGLYTTGELTKNYPLRKTALLSLESWLISGFIAYVFKIVAGRARPYTEASKNTFHMFSGKSRFHSFPSGHSSSAFAVATTIADQTEDVLVDFFAYTLATLVALSRIHDNKHWLSDVFVGSAIGYFVAKKICALNRSPKSTEFRVGFSLAEGRQAVSFSLSF